MMIDRMWEILTTFTDETKQSIFDKCKEIGYDTNRGVVSLEESFINLISAKNVLSDTIEKKKLIQLPITIQQSFLSQLESISRSLTSLIGGTDEVINLVQQIEQLNVAIWQYGLHNMSDQVLGFLEKMNQLKQQEINIVQLRNELQLGLGQKTALEILLEEARSSKMAIEELKTQAEGNLQETKDSLAAAAQASDKSAALLAIIQQTETTSTELVSSTKVSNAEVIALEPKIKEFYSLIDQYRSKINATTDDAENTIKANNDETVALISTLKELEGQIRNQIEKATGFSLFHSFQTRQLQLATSKKFWIYALAGLVIASWAISIYVISTTTNFDVAFFGKLSMTIPLIYAIFFCTVQYGRERKLEEEYAFKSNISISLVPYQELVDKIVDSAQQGEREKFTAFIIDAITKVYTSPTDKVFESEHKQKNPSVDPLKNLEKILKGIIDPLKPLLEMVKR